MSDTPRSSPVPGGSQPGTGSGATRPASPGHGGIIGRYQILDKIGEGGMGSLYLARDPAIDRLVAIKLLRRGFDTEAVRERFAREARAAGRLRHPNIVTIFDVGEHEGDPFIAMEFLAGETLAELIRHNAGLSLSRRLKLLEELCDGLAYAHRAGLVHRDIKPANLMVDAEGVLKILDFGIVRVGDSGMTQAGVLVGTINYMSPEQVLGTGVDHRSDIFSVGLVAYELLTGRQAFPGTMKDGLLRRIPNAEIDPLANVVPGLDPEVIAIVERALRKDPADRYQELARMRNDLARVRQRIEVEEERAAIEAAAASGETALIADAVTSPGTPLPRSSDPLVGPAADAERALAEGNYRVALTLAARLAALNPQDRSPSTIVARAEHALLERGRTIEASRPITPASGAGAPSASSNSLPVSSAPASPPSTGVGAQPVNYLAITVAVLALAVAGFAVYSRVDRPDFGSDGSVTGAAQTSSTGSRSEATGPPVPPAAETSGQSNQASPDPSTTTGNATTEVPPASSSQSQSVERETARGGGAGPAPETRSSSRGPSGASDSSRTQARRGNPTSSPERAPATGEREPRETPLPRETQPPSQGAASPNVPQLNPASPSSGLPLPGGSRPSAPPPPNSPEVKPAPKPEAERAPARDLHAEARAAVESLLQRYEAAREARDFAALRRIWDMPNPRAVQQSMSAMREYDMEFLSREITVSEDARRATAVCRIRIRFRQVGATQEETVTQTFSFERRGDTWIIAGLSGR